MTIEYDDFDKVDIRVGTVTDVEDFPRARKPAYRLTVDFGPEIGERRTSVQVTTYAKEEIHGMQVVAVVNFAPKRIAGFPSEVLVLGAMDEQKGVVLLEPDDDVEPGARIG